MYVASKTVRILLWILAGVGVACLALVALIFWSADPLEIRAPSDHAIIALFQAHQAEFDRLRQLATEDMHNANIATFDLSSINRISPQARREQYRTLLSLRSDLVVGVNYDESVRFIFASGGLSAIGPGWVKGIQYSKSFSRIGKRVATLDNEKTLPEGVYLRELTPDWFIFFQKVD